MKVLQSLILLLVSTSALAHVSSEHTAANNTLLHQLSSFDGFGLIAGLICLVVVIKLLLPEKEK